jgi:hypothetical protein
MDRYAVAAMLEEAPRIAPSYHVESSAHRSDEGLAGTRLGSAQ